MKTTLNHALKASTTSTPETQVRIRQLKLGVDWHADHLRVARMCDGQSPQPAQRFSQPAFLAWLKKQKELADALFVVYEAGPGAFHLYREILELGVGCYVVHPEKLDPRCKGVVTDKTDCRELVLKLDRYVNGNTRAMSVVRVPTPAEEQRRALSRQREQLRRERQRLAAQGRSLCLTQGYRLRGEWWQAPLSLPQWLMQRLEVWRQLIQAVETQLEELTKAVEALAPKERPKGLGPLTFGTLLAELCDWTRFKNRKQIGSYTGLCGGVSSSGQSHCDLSITKAGNARVRWALVELAWRMVRFQPQCQAVQRWKHVLLVPQAAARQKKRALVALARQLAVDLWRWQTGKVTPAQLGWVMVQD
jgi:transposase